MLAFQYMCLHLAGFCNTKIFKFFKIVVIHSHNFPFHFFLSFLFFFEKILEHLRGFPGGAVVKTLPVNAEGIRDTSSIPGLGRYPGVGNGNPFQCSCLKIPWTEEPDGLQSMGSQTVGHDWACMHYYYYHNI